MSVMQRCIRRSTIISIALANALVLWPDGAGAAPRNDTDPAAGRDSSSRSSSSAGDRAEARSPSPAPSTPAGDTRPAPGTSGRVTDDARGRGVAYRGRTHPRGGYGGHYGGHYGGYYGGHYGGYYGSSGYYPWGWFGYWGSPYFYWGDYYGSLYSRTVVYPNDRYGESGALDMDVSPERAEVYLDGQRIGRADDFDGFPTLLWLERGTYDLVIYLPGFRTLSRQVTIYPGLIVDVEDRLERGESVRPEDLPARSHDRRDARIRDDRERGAAVDGAARARGDRGDDWRVRRGSSVDAGQGRDDDDDEEAEDEDNEDDGRSSMAGDSAAVRIGVEPRDASVYLDGRFVGTGNDLARLPAGIVVEPGEHELEVVRPGHRPQRQRFAVRSGDSLDLEVELEAD